MALGKKLFLIFSMSCLVPLHGFSDQFDQVCFGRGRGADEWCKPR